MSVSSRSPAADAPPDAPPQSNATPDRDTPGPGVVPAAVPDAQDRFDQKLLNAFGLRPKLADRGLTLDASLTADYSKPLQGGGTRGNAFRTLFDFRTELDTDKAFGWHGGTLSVDFQNQSGRNGSGLVGDVQGFDNVDADGRTQISELWYEQWFGDVFRVKLGKSDANVEFAATQYGSQFLSSSFAYSPTLVGLPTYPDPAVGVNAFVYPADWFYAGYGLYDRGVGEPTGDRPASTLWRGPTDLFQIMEAGVKWKLAGGTLPGRIAAGVTYGDGDIARFDGGTRAGYASAYAIGEQKLARTDPADDNRGVYAFAMLGAADEDVAAVRHHLAAGVTWVGPYAAKNLDSLGVGVTSAFLSRAAGAPFTQDAETAVELYYNFQATRYLSLKPDLQYIIHPGGDRARDNAIVATLRLTVAF